MPPTASGTLLAIEAAFAALDLATRLAEIQFRNDPVQLEQYIERRNELRKQLVDAANDFKEPTDAGNPPSQVQTRPSTDRPQPLPNPGV